MNFKDIKFGNADGKEEGAYQPELLTKGYLNVNGVVEAVKQSSKFLFLGPKGSGKSALSEHLKLTSDKHNSFLNTIMLKDFPYRNLLKIIVGDETPQTKLPSAWDWILLIYIIDSLSKDKGLKRDENNEWEKTIKKLTSVGLCPSTDIQSIVNRSSKWNFRADVAGMFNVGYTSETSKIDSETQFYHLIKHLKDLIAQVKTDSNHYLVIDGLDEVLQVGNDRVQFISLAALINEAKSLNLFFNQNGLKIKIIVLCRTDLFERLPDPNKNKIRRDSSFLMHWQPESNQDSHSPLIRLVNLRASIVFEEEVDVFDKFFPKTFDSVPLAQSLLNYTRHTPRDFLQLLNFIQELSNVNSVDYKSVQTGIGEYSVRYFLPEIMDEMVGYLDGKQIRLAVEAMSTVRSKNFTFSNLEDNIRRIDKEGRLDCKELLYILFECGAIGQSYDDRSGKHRYNFKYRNPHSSIQLNDRFLFHKGLWKSFNIN